MKNFLPYLLIVFGFITINMYNGLIAGACMVTGIAMIMERIWPEKWDAPHK